MAALLFVLFISLTSWILSLPHNNNKCSDDGCTDNSSPHQANGTTQQSSSKEPSLLQQPNCSFRQTAICFENKTQAEGRRQSLQSNISWNCTSSSAQVNIYNCKDRAFNTTKMCCEFSIKKRNRTESTGPAYCLERYSDHTGKTSLRSWDCYWQFSVLRILSTSRLDDAVNTWHRKGALYFSDCKTPNNNSYIHNCSDSELITKNETSPSLRPGSATTSAKPIHTYQINTTTGYSTAKTTQPGTASTEKKHKNKLSSQNTTFTALGESLTGKAKLRNCTSYSIQTSLVEMEDIARQKMGEILRANLTRELSFRNQIIELHLVVTRDFNNRITVPDPSNADKPFRSLVSVPPGSIDAKHGRLGLLVVVFYFEGLCGKETEDLNVMASSNGYWSLRSPIVSVLAMSPKGDINTLKDNATITFGRKITDQSTVKCVFLNRTGSSRPSWSGDGMTLDTDQKANYTICLTDHFTSFAVLIDYQNDSPLDQISRKKTPITSNRSYTQISEAEKFALDLITKVGCGISLVCLVACILTFGCFRNLSMTRYRIHLNLCIALAASQLVFLAGIEATSKKGVCLAVAIMLHYFFTASFSWMCIKAFHLFTKIVSVFNLQQIRMRYYFAVGWGTPAIIVMITVSVNLSGYTTPELCWLSLEGGLIWAFISPVIIIILINVAVLIAVVVVRVSLKGNPLTPSENKKLSAALRTVVVLFPLLGLCWAFGLMAVVTKRRPFLYAFALLSTLQGAFICLFQCIGRTEKSKRESRSNGSKKDKNKPESKSLPSMLSVSHCDRKDKPTATEV